MNEVGQTGATPMARTHVMTTAMAVRSEPGKGYDNPKQLREAKEALKGDIFQVSHYDAGVQFGLREGDFLIAQCDLPTPVACEYPYPGKSNDCWKYAWTKTTNFTLILENGRNAGTIYGNGLNQIGVQVHFMAADDNGIAVPLSPAVMQHAVQLLDYTSGQALPSGWNEASEANQYHTLPKGQRTQLIRICLPQSGNVEPALYQRYVSCAIDARARDLTVGAKITTSSGKVYTSSYDGDVHNSVEIQALEPKILRAADFSREIQKIKTKKAYPVKKSPLEVASDWWQIPDFTQHDYYFSPKDSNVSILNWTSKGLIYDDTPKSGWIATHRNSPTLLDMFFLWDGSTKKGGVKKVGDPDYPSSGSHGDYIIDLCGDFDMPDKQNAICASRLEVASIYNWYETSHFFDNLLWSISTAYAGMTFTAYDVYGNGSTIGVRTTSNNQDLELYDV